MIFIQFSFTNSVLFEMPRTVDHSGIHAVHDNYNPPEKREHDLLLNLELGHVTLQMPKSRKTRSIYSSSPPRKTWPRLIAKTYNENAVGSFAGNFDKPINLNIRAGNTILSFREFVEFSHDPEEACHVYEVDIVKYFKYNDVSKLKSLTVSEKPIYLELSGPATEKGKTSSHLDKILYPCTNQKCIIPCVCYLCNDENPDECDHKIMHPGFFNPKEHLFTVRNADTYDINLNEDDLQDGNRYCTNRTCRGCVVPHRRPQRSFNYRFSCLQMSSDCLCTDCPYCKSLDVLKYAGTLDSCESCKMKLIHHESYHLIYHYNCLFCIESLQNFKNIVTEKDYWDNFDGRRFDEKVSCQFCSRIFFDKQKKQRHIEIIHSQNTEFLFKCKECDRAFGSKQALNYHIDSYHEEVDLGLLCGICEKTFKMDQNLDQHMREVHSEISLECDLCFSTFTRQSNLNHHYKVVHDISINSLYINDDPTIFDYFECDLCEFVSREKRTLVHHEKFVHHKDELEILFCDVCQFKTYEKKTLNRHKRIVHENSQLEYCCNFCNFRTKWKASFKRHNDNIHGEKGKTFECNECDYHSKFKQDLKRHIKRVHKKNRLKSEENQPDTVFKCDQCEHRTLDEQVHLVHSTSDHHECEKCDFKTITIELMDLHKVSNHKQNRRKRKLV